MDQVEGEPKRLHLLLGRVAIEGHHQGARNASLSRRLRWIHQGLASRALGPMLSQGGWRSRLPSAAAVLARAYRAKEGLPFHSLHPGRRMAWVRRPPLNRAGVGECLKLPFDCMLKFLPVILYMPRRKNDNMKERNGNSCVSFLTPQFCYIQTEVLWWARVYLSVSNPMSSVDFRGGGSTAAD